MADEVDGEGLRDASDLGTDEAAEAARWILELQAARKGPYKRWLERSRRAIRRFRDEDVDDESAGSGRRNARFNVLWSNVQTVGPSIYSRPPKAVAERRYLDRDVIARAAATILQRALAHSIEESDFHEVMKQCRTDYQLVAFASAWLRYEVETDAGDAQVMSPAAVGDEDEAGDREEGEAEREPEIKSQRIVVDYTHWSDDLVSSCRFWQERTWRAKRAYYKHRQAAKKFGREIADALPYSTRRGRKESADITDQVRQAIGTAEVWQIWDMIDRKIIYICEGYAVRPLLVEDDELHLPGFVPAARPLRGTTTNDSFWPIPDYSIWYDQAAELDNLTARIAALTRAIKVVGVFDNSQPDLARLLNEGMENKLIGVDNWAKLMQRGGLDGSVSLLPIKEMAEVLVGLYQARGQVKSDLYEISGVSDVLRGSTDPTETATAQRLKGQFGSLRGSDRKSDFDVFVRDTLVLMAEIMLELFTSETLWLMSDFEQWWSDQSASAYGEKAPGMGHNGGPPLDGAPQIPMMAGQATLPPMSAPQQSTLLLPPQAGAHPSQPEAPSAQTPMQQPGAAPMMPPAALQPPPPPPPTAREVFDRAVDLLRNDKLRSFRIQVETNSTIEPDAEMERASRNEFIAAVTAFMAQAKEMAASFPQMIPVMGKMLLFAARGFPVGRELESSLETLVADLDAQARNPKPQPPSPEEIKAQSAREKGQMDAAKMKMQMQQDQRSFALEIQKLQMELQAMREKLMLQKQELELKLQMQQQTAHMKMRTEQQTQALKVEGAQVDAAIKQQQGQQELRLDAQRGELERDAMHRQAAHDDRMLSRREAHEETRMDIAERQAQIKRKQMEAGK
jgi:hypothetical protein